MKTNKISIKKEKAKVSATRIYNYFENTFGILANNNFRERIINKITNEIMSCKE